MGPAHHHVGTLQTAFAERSRNVCSGESRAFGGSVQVKNNATFDVSTFKVLEPGRVDSRADAIEEVGDDGIVWLSCQCCTDERCDADAAGNPQNLTAAMGRFEFETPIRPLDANVGTNPHHFAQP